MALFLHCNLNNEYISTGNLEGDVLPTHGYTNKLLKTKAKTIEKAVIEK